MINLFIQEIVIVHIEEEQQDKQEIQCYVLKHSSYDKEDEKIRYDDLYMVFSGKWVFIRFNPDSYMRKK